jgi:aspartyl-tRNA(Asn)/glutamyl-tRNA(Gln) amidotransferase subunit C
VATVGVETVDQVAALARLSLTPEERDTFARQLQQILSYAESIQALDTKDVPPMSHPHAAGSLRGDEASACLSRDEALESAPDGAEGLFRVPRVLGG